MRKLAAISFLGLFLFNIVGYRFFFSFLQQKSGARLEASLDKGQYDLHELITLRVPLSMPYISDWKEFRRVDGEIDVNGKNYRYVMRKVENGQLVLLCLPDYDRSTLENARESFAARVNGTAADPVSKKGAPSLQKISFNEEYEDSLPSFVTVISPRSIKHGYHSFCDALSACYIPAAGKPPRAQS